MTYAVRVIGDGPGLNIPGFTELVGPDHDVELVEEERRRFKQLAVAGINAYFDTVAKEGVSAPESMVLFIDPVPGTTHVVPGSSPADAGHSPADGASPAGAGDSPAEGGEAMSP